MERAKTLLRRTNLKIIDVAFECGYSSSQYFTNAFKQANGVTPGEYRANVTSFQAVGPPAWEGIQFRSEEEELKWIAAKIWLSDLSISDWLLMVSIVSRA